MTLTPTQLEIIRQNSKDDAAYETLVRLINAVMTVPEEEALRCAPVEDIPAELARLRESEIKYRQLFELESDAIFLIDNEVGNILEVNTSACNLYGYSREELLQLRNVDLSAQPDQTAQAMRRYASHIPVRYHHKRDGTVFPVEITASFFTWQGRPVHIAAIRDITQRLLAEASLRESENRYRSFIEMSPLGVIVHRQGVVIFANKTATLLLGTDAPESLTGRPLSEFIHPDDYPLAAAQFQAVVDTGQNTSLLEQRFLHDDGHAIDVEVASASLNYEGVTSVITVFADISERKEAAQRAFDLALERERVQLLNKFIQDISHEFRTPLANLTSYLYLLDRDLTPEKRKHYIATMKEQIDSLTELVEDMINMSRLDSNPAFDPQLVDLNTLLRTAASAIEEIRLSHQITLDLDPQLPSLEGDAEMLYLALMHLVSNAVHYTPEGGAISLRTRCGERGSLILEVADTGIGIDEADQKHIFERFYRADPACTTRGSGLGLAIALKIIEGHGGRIEVQSALGKGSIFRVILPRP